MEDAAIVSLYWARDPAAVSATQEKYGGACQQLAAGLLGSVEDGEECLNDALHRLWETIPPKRPESLKGYLKKIVRNLAIDRWRSRRAAFRGSGLETLALELEECCPGLPRMPSAEEAVEGKETAAAIDRWLETLPREDRILFVRRYWYGDALEDLALRRGMKRNALSQKLHRLRGSLRRHLEKEGITV